MLVWLLAAQTRLEAAVRAHSEVIGTHAGADQPPDGAHEQLLDYVMLRLRLSDGLDLAQLARSLWRARRPPRPPPRWRRMWAPAWLRWLSLMGQHTLHSHGSRGNALRARREAARV